MLCVAVLSGAMIVSPKGAALEHAANPGSKTGGPALPATDGEAKGAAQADASVELMAFVTSQQRDYQEAYRKLSYDAVSKSRYFDENFQKAIEQTQLYSISKRGSTCLVAIESDSVLREIEQRKNGKKLPSLFVEDRQPRAMRLLLTEAFQLAWLDLSLPQLHYFKTADWQGVPEKKRNKVASFWSGVNIEKLCFGLSNPLTELWTGPDSSGIWSATPLTPESCRISRGTPRTPRDLLFEVDMRNGGLVREATFTPPVGSTTHLTITYQETVIDGKAITVPVKLLSKTSTEDGVVEEASDITFTNFRHESGDPEYKMLDLGFPEGSILAQGFADRSWKYYKWNMGELEEISAELVGAFGKEPVL